jgi:hypothetical protein
MQEEVIYDENFTRALQDHDSGRASTPVYGVEHPAPRTNLDTENSSLRFYYWHPCWSYVRTPILLKGVAKLGGSFYCKEGLWDNWQPK